MGGLLIDSSLAQIETALRETCILGLKARVGTLANLTALRAIRALGASGTPINREYTLYYVTSASNVFWWRQASTLADDNANVIKPVDVTGPGRWIKATSSVVFGGKNIATIETGYLREVVLHDGDFSPEALQARVFGQQPCVAIHFSDEEHTPMSQISGALYDYRVRFEVWSVSRNYRDEREAAIGPDLLAESAVDPGALRIHGAVKKLFAGQTLGNTGIKLINPGAGRLELADSAERIFVMALELDIFGSIHNPDDASELETLTRIDIQRYRSQADTNDKYDEANAVTLGLDVPLGTGYSKTIAAGSATIAGVVVTASSTAHTFSSTLDTYRDLTPAGAWVFTEVVRGATPNAPTAGNLRVGYTVTDSAGVSFDQFLCSVTIPSENPDQISL